MISELFCTKINSYGLVMICLNRIYFEALRGIRHQFEKSHFQSSMNSAKIEAKANLKLMMKLEWMIKSLMGGRYT